MNRHLYIVVNVDWFFLSHRLPLALAAKQNGYDVTIVTKNTGKKGEIESYGLGFKEIPFDRSGSKLYHELKCVYLLYKLYKKQKPDIIHHVTLKASLLGCFAAKLQGHKKVVNAISGFGYNFMEGREGFKQNLIKFNMKLAFKSKNFQYIFQNPDDINQFSSFRFVENTQINLIKGSGIDLNKFVFQDETPKDKVRLILFARMLYDKGIVEFINAAKKIKNEVENKAEFVLIGDCDVFNLAGIQEKQLLEIIEPPYIDWTGFEKNIFTAIKNADVVVLPSYREGLPKSLIEACAVGRPIITTDTQGCRECVLDAYNGYLVPIKDINMLAQKMIELIENKEKRIKMGKNSRTLAEKEFSLDLVIDKHLKIYSKMSKTN